MPFDLRGSRARLVGLGADVEREALVAMASRPDYAHFAPEAEDLEGIYRAIAVTVPCPPGAFWSRR